MADMGMTVIGDFTYGGRIGRVSRIQIIRGKEEYSRQDLPSEEEHMTILVEAQEAWRGGEICLPLSVGIPLAKAMLSVAEYAKRQEIALPH